MPINQTKLDFCIFRYGTIYVTYATYRYSRKTDRFKTLEEIEISHNIGNK